MKLKKMDSTEDQLAEMLREFKSRSKAKVIVESGLYSLVHKINQVSLSSFLLKRFLIVGELRHSL